tara:strand:- start:1288 stop:1992 length:705 start_codon:yes stop_codon:yes gene_type:complete
MNLSIKKKRLKRKSFKKKGGQNNYHKINVSSTLNVNQINNIPPIYEVKNFLSHEECCHLMNRALPYLETSKVVDFNNNTKQNNVRTSTSCYFSRESNINICKRLSEIVNKDVNCFELLQVGRYLPNQFYRQHYDSIPPSTKLGKSFCKNGGNRIITALIYLNDVKEGGNTYFPKLDIRIKPEQGKLLLFFPSFTNGKVDKKALHIAEDAIDEKWVSQIWIRQHERIQGIPSDER